MAQEKFNAKETADQFVLGNREAALTQIMECGSSLEVAYRAAEVHRELADYSNSAQASFRRYLEALASE